MQRGSRSWTRDDDVKLIEAAIFAKRRSRVAARVDLGKNGPKFYYDNASEQLKHLPSDWKQRFNHLLDLYRGERMTVQLSKMLAAAKDGRLYRDKSSTEAVDRSESNESDAEEPVFEAEEVIPQHNKREKAKADTVDNDPDLSDRTLHHVPDHPRRVFSLASLCGPRYLTYQLSGCTFSLVYASLLAPDTLFIGLISTSGAGLNAIADATTVELSTEAAIGSFPLSPGHAPLFRLSRCFSISVLKDASMSTGAYGLSLAVALNGKRNGVHPNKRVKEEPPFSRKDRLLARDRATDRAKRARESADSGPDEKPAVGDVGHLDTEHERDMMVRISQITEYCLTTSVSRGALLLLRQAHLPAHL